MLLVHVSLLVAKGGDRVTVDLHVLHDDVIWLLGDLPCELAVAATLHRVLARRLRPLLDTLSMVRALQALLEARAAADRRQQGRPRSLRRLVDPVALHDACTLYAGLAGALVAPARAAAGGWVSLGPCRCGVDEWGVTCTPPRWTRDGRLVRDLLDACCAFCWSCLARRPAPPDLGAALRQPLRLTHMAPQNFE